MKRIKRKPKKKKTTTCNFLLDMTTKLHREVVIQHVQKEEPHLAWLALTQTYEGKTEIERRAHLELIKYKIPQTYKAHKKTTSAVLLSLVSAIGILATKFQLLHITMSDADKKSLFSLSLSKDMSVEMDSVNINSPNISYNDLSQRMISTLQTREFSQSISEVDKVTESIETSATGLQALSKQDISDKDRGKFEGECFYCKKKGHRKRDCFQLKKKLEKEEQDYGRSKDHKKTVMARNDDKDRRSRERDRSPERDKKSTSKSTS